MRRHTLLVLALVAAGASTPLLAQATLPADWDRKVSAVVPEPLRAERVTEGGRRFDAKRRASLDAMKAANAEMKSVFLSREATDGNRRLSLNVFRDDRRKATLAAVDTLLEMRGLVSKKEWKEIWPEGYFEMPLPSQLLAVKVQEALPGVVSDPARLKAAQDVAAGLVAAFIFAVQMLNFPVANGTSGHLLGGALAAVLVGPWTAVLCMSTVFIVQCLLFADGGIMMQSPGL